MYDNKNHQIFQDRNECASNNGGCGTTSAARCYNTRGSFYCRCNTGYTGSRPCRGTSGCYTTVLNL